MPRELPLGNGSLLVNFDASSTLRDVYFPRVGRDNNSLGHPFRVGLFVEGEFIWLDAAEWKRELAYVPDTLVTDVTLVHERLGLALRWNDCVSHEHNALLRLLTIDNLAPRPRAVRIFFAQDFHVAETSAGNTAYYEPVNDVIVHYRGRRYFVVDARSEAGGGIAQYATGIAESGEHEGTWRDCEDGELSGNAIAHGSVDSALALDFDMAAGDRARASYWIAAERGFFEARDLSKRIETEGPETFVNATRLHWRAWSEQAAPDLGNLSARVQSLYRRSLLTIRTNSDSGGAIIAATDSDSANSAIDGYAYAWPRVGAFVAHALDLAGRHEIGSAFFDFCASLMPKPSFYEEGYLLHKFNPDGSLGSSWHPWIREGRPKLPIQEDGTALVVWALWRHHRLSGGARDIERLYATLVRPAARFMLSYRDEKTGLPRESYDVWEERYGVHTFTTAAVVAALMAAMDLARSLGDAEIEERCAAGAADMKRALLEHLYRPELGRFCRTLDPDAEGTAAVDCTVDASLAIPFVLGLLDADDPAMAATMRAIEERLTVRSGVGGVARYEGDHTSGHDETAGIPGNPWFVPTLWLAQWRIALAAARPDLAAAEQALEWACAHASVSGMLAEQLDPFTGAPRGASPLTWSHAAFVETALLYGRRWSDLADASTVSLTERLRSDLEGSGNAGTTGR